MSQVIVQNKAQSKLQTRGLIAILFVCWLGFAVRVIHLGGDSFWYDELLTFYNSGQDINTILAERVADRPPGYYAIEHYGRDLWGQSEAALRLPSTLAGSVTIPLIYVVGGLIANRRVGMLAAILLAVSPFHLRYSQEARGYAIQVALATASTACMLLALSRRRKRWWIGFGLVSALNAYVLFGAFLILASQLAFVGLLVLVQLFRKRWTLSLAINQIAGLSLSGLIFILLYLPYFGPALSGMLANIGPDARQGAYWADVPIVDWVSAAYIAFGYLNSLAAFVVGLLGVIGLSLAIVRRKTELVLWLLAGAVLPLIIINLIGVSRAPLAKYVLFTLPVYFLAVSLGLTGLVELVTRRRRSLQSVLPVVLAVGLIVISLPAVAAEQRYAEEDWKTIVEYLGGVAYTGDVFVPITLDLPDGFNQGSVGLSHYLSQILPDFHLLVGEHLTDSPAAELGDAAHSTGSVWFMLLDRVHPIQFDDPNVQVIPFQGSTYLVHFLKSNLSPLEAMIALYQKIIPQALTPAPQCYLWLDLARLHIELNQYDEAHAAIAHFQMPCPDTAEMRQMLYHSLLDHDLQTRQVDQAHKIAMLLIGLNAKDETALRVLTLYDLGAMYASQTAFVESVPSPTLPIQSQRFTMPQNGDWGDALVMQTPAQLSFQLQLPAEMVRLVSRVAMAPESWAWGGNGSRFIVRVQPARGDTAILFDQYVSNDEPDRTWHAVDIPLDQFAGQTVTLTLQTDPGPQGDTTGDWAGWDSPRIVYSATH